MLAYYETGFVIGIYCLALFIIVVGSVHSHESSGHKKIICAILVLSHFKIFIARYKTVRYISFLTS